MGRFLTEVAGFANTPALLGSVELIEGDRRSAIAIVHAFVENQGDAWTVTSAYLDRFVEDSGCWQPASIPAKARSRLSYLRHMSQTGRRVAEMHMALASNKDIADFAPEPIRPEDAQRWIDDIWREPNACSTRLTQQREATGKPIARWSMRCWRSARPCRTPQGAAAARCRRPQHPSPWRFPSRPDADRQGRHLHHRFRRRAATGRSPSGAARRRPRATSPA